MHGTNHVEMDWVTAQDESLSDVVKLDTIDTSGCSLIARGVHDNDGTILVVCRRLLISLVLHISREKSNFGTHLNEVIAEVLHTSVVLV